MDDLWFLFHLESHCIPFFFCFEQTIVNDRYSKGLFIFITQSVYNYLYKSFFDHHPLCIYCSNRVYSFSTYTLILKRRFCSNPRIKHKAHLTHIIISTNIINAYQIYMERFEHSQNKIIYIVKDKELYKLAKPHVKNLSSFIDPLS